MKRACKLTVLLLGIWIGISVWAQPFEPVNPNASKEVKELLSYLYSLKGARPNP